MDTTFPHLYECEQLSESIPAQSPHYYYPGASTLGGRDGVVLEVRASQGQSWIGTFEFGRITPKGVSGIFTTPDPRLICVVAKGNGYFVNVDTPASWHQVSASPVIDVRAVAAQGILVFANFTELVAYGQAGIKWRTTRLSWDGMQITSVTDSQIEGDFWDIRIEGMARFVVDLATGTHKGGVSES